MWIPLWYNFIVFCSGCLMLGCSQQLKHLLLYVKVNQANRILQVPPCFISLHSVVWPQFSANGKSSLKFSLLLNRTAAAACLNLFVWRIIYHLQFKNCRYLSLSKKHPVFSCVDWEKEKWVCRWQRHIIGCNFAEFFFLFQTQTAKMFSPKVLSRFLTLN